MGELSRRTIAADRGDVGVRLDRVLLRRLADLPRISRTQVQRWIENGQVTVDGRRVARTATRVAAGDLIEICYPTPPPRLRPLAESAPLAVLHEDDDLSVIDKPAGVVVHPSYRHASGTLFNALLGRAAAGGWTPRLVHRLDKQTSGVLVVARNLEAHRALTRAWATLAVRKHYLAIVVGRPPKPRGEIRLPLGRDPIDRRRVAVVRSGGRESLTRYRVLASSRGLRSGLSLVACELGTGRMHQVRVHLAAIGCPIVGDAAYGRGTLPPAADARLAAEVVALGRHALHAWRIDLRLPARDALRVTAPLPPDMAGLLASAGIEARPLLDCYEASLDTAQRLSAGPPGDPRPVPPARGAGAGDRG